MNNSIVLDGCIEEFKSENSLKENNNELFEIFCLSQAIKSMDFTYDQLNDSIVDGGQDGGIDSIVIILDDDYTPSIDSFSEFIFNKNTVLKIVISQSKEEKSFKESAVDKLLASFPVLFNLEIQEEELCKRFNPTLVSKILILRSLWLKVIMKVGTIILDVNYFCKANEVEVNSAFKSKVSQLKEIATKQINGSSFSFKCQSAKEILDLYQKERPSRLELIFKEVPITTNFVEGYGYVGIVGLKDYYNFITDDDDIILEKIFESNIRHYQGDIDVNNKIKDSLDNEFDIDFWWLNNGVTIIAEQPSQVSKTLSIENVQIVNGLQTTFTLGKYFKRIDNESQENRSILVKVIIIEGETNSKAIDKIIASTNSQNAVPPVLLRATDDIQRKLELFFLNEGFFYDRRKNFYKNMGKPADKIFTIQSAAQAVQSIVHKEPDTARSKPTTLIKTKESYEKIFNDKTEFKIYLICCLILKSVNDFIKTKLNGEAKSVAKAYALHLSRSLVSVITGVGNYKEVNISSIDILKITDEHHKENLKLMLRIISDFKLTSKTTSDSSVSKSGKFRDHLNEDITKKY